MRTSTSFVTTQPTATITSIIITTDDTIYTSETASTGSTITDNHIYAQTSETLVTVTDATVTRTVTSTTEVIQTDVTNAFTAFDFSISATTTTRYDTIYDVGDNIQLELEPPSLNLI